MRSCDVCTRSPHFESQNVTPDALLCGCCQTALPSLGVRLAIHRPGAVWRMGGALSKHSSSAGKPFRHVGLCPPSARGGMSEPQLRKVATLAVRAQGSLGCDCLGTCWRGRCQHLRPALIAHARGLGVGRPRKGESLRAHHVSTVQQDLVSSARPWAECWGRESEGDTATRQERRPRGARRWCPPRSSATSRASSGSFASSPVTANRMRPSPLQP